ncbi:hypothetical protein FJQ54_02110 [Sandaracinobacter neustonicus]|uniref:Uncharacterized protein n=1 Tax=Sandaracinobacter neustonicus TaxID=1715348 RepID=A0A501XSX5_9SPHN|nr:hypothetical protein FJQ54_02110 [Sandaracinobacter neustonicus]
MDRRRRSTDWRTAEHRPPCRTADARGHPCRPASATPPRRAAPWETPAPQTGPPAPAPAPRPAAHPVLPASKAGPPGSRSPG